MYSLLKNYWFLNSLTQNRTYIPFTRNYLKELVLLIISSKNNKNILPILPIFIYLIYLIFYVSCYLYIIYFIWKLLNKKIRYGAEYWKKFFEPSQQ